MLTINTFWKLASLCGWGVQSLTVWPMISHVYKRVPKVKLRRAQNVHWSMTRNHHNYLIFWDISRKTQFDLLCNKALTFTSQNHLKTLKKYKIYKLCMTSTCHTFARREITLVLERESHRKCKQVTWSIPLYCLFLWPFFDRTLGIHPRR